MAHFTKKFSIMALTILILSSNYFLYLQEKNNKIVVYLNSYHKGLQWSDELEKGLKKTLTDLNKSAHIITEYMDTKRISDSEHMENLKAVYKHKYKNQKIDLVIASDDNACKFMDMFGKEIFHETRAVLCGINNINLYKNKNPNYIYHQEGNYLKENIQLTESLFPDRDQINIICDNETSSGKALTLIFKDLEKEYSGIFEFRYLNDLTLEELERKVEEVSSKGILFLSNFNRDKNGKFYSKDDLIEAFQGKINAPLISQVNFIPGKGMLGGIIKTGYEEGLWAGTISNDLLENSIKYKINPYDKIKGKAVFDYATLKEYGINMKKLPPHSHIYNKPKGNFFRIPKQLMLIYFVFYIILLATILLQIHYHKKMKEAKEKAEESDRLKTAFLANMSHEIRTPLNGILGFSNILATEELNEEEKVEYKKIIDSCSRQLLYLISDILDSAKIENGQLKIFKEKILLNNVMREIFDVFKKENILEKDIEFIYNAQNHNTENYILTDENRLKQILNNLLGNAFKFTHTGYVEFGYSVEKDSYLFYVKDTGIGINKKDRELVFSRFGRADKEESKKYRGTGLGLSITKELVKILGGEIWFKSEENNGTIFYFTLPIN